MNTMSMLRSAKRFAASDESPGTYWTRSDGKRPRLARYAARDGSRSNSTTLIGRCQFTYDALTATGGNATVAVKDRRAAVPIVFARGQDSRPRFSRATQ